jgi:hypothetical protein
MIVDGNATSQASQVHEVFWLYPFQNCDFFKSMDISAQGDAVVQR